MDDLGGANTGRDALTKAEMPRPSVVIIDITMPELNRIDAARQILKASPSTAILAEKPPINYRRLQVGITSFA
jgi:DNA-binding NarL/FixJ family response regulator